MTLGEKIKQARKSKKITQEELCKDKITRNMLSAIENGKAQPSIDTLRFLALSLELPIAYLLSNDDNIGFYQKAEKISDIRRLYSEQKYKRCVDLINSISGNDDELNYILCCCHFKLGRQATLDGSLMTAKKHLEISKDLAQKTVYNTEVEEVISELYLSVVKNINAPLLELDQKDFEIKLSKLCDTDFYRFILQDKEHSYLNGALSDHMKAKGLIKNRKLHEALTVLKEIESSKSSKNYNVYVILNLYSDFENCYKELGDFENAYKYSSKRMNIIEQLKS